MGVPSQQLLSLQCRFLLPSANSSCLEKALLFIVGSVVSAAKPRRSRGLRAAEGPGELGLADYIGHAQKEVIQ